MTTPRLLKALCLVPGLLGGLLASNAHAATAAKLNVNATSLFFQSLTVSASGATIETLNLSAGGDTVIHVQDGTTGGFVAGNDDFSGLASKVTIPSSFAGRTVKVIVRGYASTTGGSATLRITNGGAPFDNSITFGGDVEFLGAGLATGARIQTVEQQFGSTDTVLLALSGDPKTGIALSDDEGVDMMSSVTLSQVCTAPCRLVIGTYPSRMPGQTTVYYDDDNVDSDGDGLRDALETTIGTSPSKLDTDADGLSDAVETFGVESSPQVLKFPFMGANALKPDLFLEADWTPCDITNPNADCGSSNTDQDYYRLPGNMAEYMAAYFAPKIALHIDTGVVNVTPATSTIWGAWGGAERVTAPTDYCSGRTAARRRLFHHVLVSGSGGGGQTAGGCSGVGWYSLQHEVGHLEGLAHGGADDYMCKPHYRSPMNYEYSYDASVSTFSKGDWVASPLNPASLDESRGLGTTDASKVGFLANWPVRATVNSTGGVDWNRDGVITTGIGRGAVSWPAGWIDCGFGAASAAPAPGRVPAMGYMGGLQLIRRNGANIEYSRLPNISRCSLNPPASDCLTPETAKAIPGQSTGGSGLLGVARYSATGTPPNLLLAYAGAGGHVYYQTYTGDIPLWSSALLAGDGTAVATDAAAVEFPVKTVNIFARSTSGQVLRWQYAADARTVTGGAGSPQLWSDNTPIVTKYAPAFTIGYQKDLGASPWLFGAFTDSTGAIVIGRFEARANLWVKLGDTIWQDNHSAFGPPGFAYVPFNASDRTQGRFYVGFNPGPQSPLALAMTEGNDMSAGAATRRMLFLPNTMMINEWSMIANGDGVSLLFDPDYDTNLRAAVPGSDGNVYLMPLVDGLVNVQYKDYDDYGIMLGNLAPSLTWSWP